MGSDLKNPLLERAIKLRSDLRRTIAEIDVLLRKAEEQLRRSRAKGEKTEKSLFDIWNKPPPDD